MSERLVSVDLAREEKPLHVLLVDDDAFVREIVGVSLRDLGLEITEVHSGGVAIEMLRDTPDSFDALVTDMTLPGGISGAQVASTMLALRPGAPVILMSGDIDALADKTIPGLRAIAKPFLARDLFRLLRPSDGRLS